MPFPILEDTTSTLFTTDSDDPLIIDLPATVNLGDLLVMFVALNEPRNNTVPSGWSRIVNRSSPEGIMIFTRVADGTEGGTTVSVDLQAPSNAACLVARISGAEAGVDVNSLIAPSFTSQPDPPSLTASFGSADNLFIAGFACDFNTSDITPITGPSGYSNLTTLGTSVGGGNDATVSIATLDKSSATEDPPVFNMSQSTGWFAFTIAVEGTADALVGGTITLSGVAQANAVVDIISCPTVSEGTKTIVEQVTADGNGDYTATVTRNTALNYWAEPRHYVEEFTGTLTPVSGTTFSTGVDLSGVSIGGANDPLYVLKSTANPSGEEVVVESRSGNDITLSYDPGFDETTTFSLGKAYGANTVLARSTVS